MQSEESKIPVTCTQMIGTTDMFPNRVLSKNVQSLSLTDLIISPGVPFSQSSHIII